MKKVSFDFDDTLTSPAIENYAKELTDKGIEVYITTSRFDDVSKYPGYNLGNSITKDIAKKDFDELFLVAKKIGIPKDHIHFTNMVYKWEYLKDKNFLFHLDDNRDELILCMENNIKAIDSWASDWKEQCEKLLAD